MPKAIPTYENTGLSTDVSFMSGMIAFLFSLRQGWFIRVIEPYLSLKVPVAVPQT